MDGAAVRSSLIADGCRIESGAVIENSVIGLRCLVGRDVTIRNSILMGNDFYESPDEIDHHLSNGMPPLGVGRAQIEGRSSTRTAASAARPD